MSLGGSWTQYPKAARILISGHWESQIHLTYETENHQVRFVVRAREELSVLHDLVQELQDLFQGPSLTVTINNFSRPGCSVLKSLGDQNIQSIVADCNSRGTEIVDDILQAIAAPYADVPAGTLANTVADWPFKSLRSIDVRGYSVNLGGLTRLVEAYLNKNSKPLLEEIVLINCDIHGMELAQATQRLAGIGITLRES